MHYLLFPVFNDLYEHTELQEGGKFLYIMYMHIHAYNAHAYVCVCVYMCVCACGCVHIFMRNLVLVNARQTQRERWEGKEEARNLVDRSQVFRVHLPI